MKKNEGQLTVLLELVLPKEIFKYFDLLKVQVVDNEVHAYLDELNIHPEEYKEEKLTSKGFHEASIIQDFPIRDKPLFLHVRRRRWLIESTREVISRDWKSVAEGTRLTNDFATFLKGVFG